MQYIYKAIVFYFSVLDYKYPECNEGGRKKNIWENKHWA